jgi:flagellar protein FliL
MTAEGTEKAKEPAKEEQKKERSSRKFPLKLILLGGAIVLVGAAGFVGWTLYGQKIMPGSKEETKASQTSENKNKPKIMLPMEPFIVNLLEKGGTAKRYLKVSLSFEVGTEDEKGVIDTHKIQLRDSILLLLSSQSMAEVSSMEGKLGLKQAILSRTNQVLGQALVNRIYFTEFVVQ